MTCNCIGGSPCRCQLMGRISFGPEWTGTAPSPDLAALLAAARLHVMTPKEIYEQKISWLRGMTGKLADPMPTREQAVKALEAMGYVDPEPETPPSPQREQIK